MELTYTKCGDYYIPNLTLPDMSGYQIGKYGRMRKRYLQEQHRIIYESMVLDGNLWARLAEIDQDCNERIDFLVPTMAKAEGVTESLKASDQMEWVRRMNNIRTQAEEVLFSELIYTP